MLSLLAELRDLRSQLAESQQENERLRELMRHALEVGQSALYVHDVCRTCYDIVGLIERESS